MSEVPSRLVSALSRSYRFERELGAGGMATVYLLCPEVTRRGTVATDLGSL